MSSSDLYTAAKGSKLKLKGEKKKPKKRKKEQETTEEDKKLKKEVDQSDTLAHGGWWVADSIEEITGPIAIEFRNQTYLKALDDGGLIVGPPHDENDPPSPEEIFTAVRAGESKISFKSGYGKFLSIEKNKELVGRSEAIGTREQFELIFEDGKLAILASNSLFLTVNSDTDGVEASNPKANESEFVKIRCQVERNQKKDERPTEERCTNARQIEINYVKKFQKFQDKRIRINTGDADEIRKAQDEGILHETLLDRRSKMKADRYCK